MTTPSKVHRVRRIADRIAYADPLTHYIGRVLIRRIDWRHRVNYIARRHLARETRTRSLRRDQCAVTALEYALIAGVLGLLVIVASGHLGVVLTTTFKHIEKAIRA